MNDRLLCRTSDRRTITSEVVTIMSEPSTQTCEVKVGDAWMAVSLPEAHARHGYTDKRCPACHGRVIVAGTYTAPFKLNLSHRKNHKGCPLAPRSFRGLPSPHPEALA